VSVTTAAKQDEDYSARNHPPQILHLTPSVAAQGFPPA
jgi:hypothetical protein